MRCVLHAVAWVHRRWAWNNSHETRKKIFSKKKKGRLLITRLVYIMYRCRKPVQSSRGVVVELSPGALYSAKQNLIFTVFPSNILAENCENEIKKKMTPLRSLMEQRWRWRAGGRKLASISTTAVHPRAQIRYTHARTHTHTLLCTHVRVRKNTYTKDIKTAVIIINSTFT